MRATTIEALKRSARISFLVLIPAVLLAVWNRRQRTAARPDASPTATHALTYTDPVRRVAKVAGTVSVIGTGWAADQARKTFADARQREGMDLSRQLRSAEQVAATLGDLKGALMKLGQMASFMDQGVPEGMKRILATLQRDAPPMSPELASGVIERELGARPEQIYAEWDPVPIAAASIGQVHRAMTHDGRAVAVKVQYPGVDVAVSADLRAATAVLLPMRAMFPALDAQVLLDEVCERVIEELDYESEARHQTLFAEAYLGHPYIHVPAVDPELSRRRVLTTELADGATFDTARSWTQTERNRVAETIYRFVFGSLYRFHVFNGDPHPGNYLLHPDGRVTFLDFGMVKKLTAAQFKPFEDMTRTMVGERDPGAFRRVIEAAGLLPAGLDLTDQAISSHFAHFYEYLLLDREFTMTAEYSSETVRRFFDPQGSNGAVMRALTIPRDMVIIQRINLGLHAVLAELGATANWRRIGEEIWPWTKAPPSTDIGREEAVWLQQRGLA